MNDCALVLGGAECLDGDLKELEHMIGGTWPGLVVAVNDAGWQYGGRVDHWATLHPENLEEKKWAFLREENGGNTDYKVWTARGHEDRGPVDYVVGGEYRENLSLGSSGWLGLVVGRSVAPKVVLAGIPMDRRGHVTDSTADAPFLTEDEEADRQRIAGYREVWESEGAKLQGTVKSLSGWTRGFFGAPDREWMGLPLERTGTT